MIAVAKTRKMCQQSNDVVQNILDILITLTLSIISTWHKVAGSSKSLFADFDANESAGKTILAKLLTISWIESKGSKEIVHIIGFIIEPVERSVE